MSTSIIDDSDPSQVQYSGGGWSKGGTSHEHDGTVTSSTAVGDSFTVSFTGTDIGVFGTLDSTSAGVVTSYSIDGAPEVQVTSTAGSGDTYNQQFWQSPTLSPQQHNLVVKMIKVNTGSGPGEGTIWFGYFQVTVASQASSTSSNSSIPTSSSTSTSATSTPNGNSSGLPTPVPTKKSSIAPIVGGVVAAILLLAVLVILFVLRQRRRSSNSTAIRHPKPEIDGSFAQSKSSFCRPCMVNITPVGHGSGGMQTNQLQNYRPPPAPAPASIPRSSLSNSNYSVPAGQSVLYHQSEAQSSLYAVNHQPMTSAPGSSAPLTIVPSRPSITKDSKSTNPSLTLAWMPEPIQHVDSGLRVVNNPQVDVKPDELPPVYINAMSETIIDDQDLAHVHYNGTWIRGGSTIEHDETVASSTVVGDSFIVDFFGNAISVYGTIDITSSGVLTNYSVDGAPAEQMTAQAGQGDTPNQQFWRSPTLDVGQHHLQVTMVKVNTNSGAGEGTIWFDYFRVTDPTIRQTSSSHKKHIGAIVGGVIGGVMLIVLAHFLFLGLRRRKKSFGKPLPFPWRENATDAESLSPHSTPDKETPTPFPFELEHTRESSIPPSTNGSVSSPTSGLSRKIMAQNQSQVSDPACPTAQSVSTSTHSPSSPSEDSRRLSTIQETIQHAVGKHNPGVINIVIPQASASSTVPSVDSSQPIQHVDSGVRAINAQSRDVSTSDLELPPVYSPV
ncbi:hypothetical protein CVT25_011854 [Psilocybe cyanescens]|uniref:Uncharacterized protein n=1 Tax=Psilocybe cyanescens TaxID=93625 RepID=A0A409WIY9_PSICY|nr:hypothetical protein CVT25_011854 [Psilocybe cyanescens]